MLSPLTRTLLLQDPRLVYTATREAAKAFDQLRSEFPRTVLERAANEKLAFELALAGAYAGKRTACLFSARSLYEAMDPLMSSAYTGVKGGCLILCYKEGEEDIGPVSLFSKLPLMTSDCLEDLSSLLPFAYGISERYQIPCLVEALVKGKAVAKGRSEPSREMLSRFERNPARWAATPRFRHQLHEALNEKIERIREEFERYGGNETFMSGRIGTITQKAARHKAGKGASLLRLATVFPLPFGTVRGFIASLDKVAIAEGPYPVMEMQIRDRDKIRESILSSPDSHKAGRKAAPDRAEHLHGFRVVRDLFGPASAINIAHGMSTAGGHEPLLAITDEDAFFHSGLPAFVNVLYNGSALTLLIKVRERQGEIEKVLRGFGFADFFPIEKAGDLVGYKAASIPAVLLFRGDL
jgi:TPP-dependent indolepyruvate ferredoxin oxidoreductase alpha subunit